MVLRRVRDDESNARQKGHRLGNADVGQGERDCIAAYTIGDFAGEYARESNAAIAKLGGEREGTGELGGIGCSGMG